MHSPAAVPTDGLFTILYSCAGDEDRRITIGRREINTMAHICLSATAETLARPHSLPCLLPSRAQPPQLIAAAHCAAAAFLAGARVRPRSRAAPSSRAAASN